MDTVQVPYADVSNHAPLQMQKVIISNLTGATPQCMKFLESCGDSLKAYKEL